MLNRTNILFSICALILAFLFSTNPTYESFSNIKPMRGTSILAPFTDNSVVSINVINFYLFSIANFTQYSQSPLTVILPSRVASLFSTPYVDSRLYFGIFNHWFLLPVTSFQNYWNTSLCSDRGRVRLAFFRYFHWKFQLSLSSELDIGI